MPVQSQTALFRVPARMPAALVPVLEYPAVKTVLLFMAGIGSAHYGLVPWYPVLLITGILLLACLLLYLIGRSNNQLFAVLLLILVALLGFLTYASRTSWFPAHHLRFMLNDLAGPCQVSGVICSSPQQREKDIRFTLRVNALKNPAGARPVTGRILVTVRQAKAGNYHYGDQIAYTGIIEKPPVAANPGAFDYARYLARKGIYGVSTIKTPGAVRVRARRQGNPLFQYIIIPLKDRIVQIIDRSVPAPGNILLKGMLLGERTGIDQKILDQFSDVGVIHILAVSGLHVGLVMAVFFAFFKFLRLSFKMTVLGTIGMLVLYMFLTELRPSVVRASIMAITILAGMLLGRDGKIYNTIAAAALFILLIWPQSLFDIGFQLSFAATLSIIYFYNRLLVFLPERLQKLDTWWKKGLIGALVVSLSAQLGTAPLTAYYFNKVPIISLAANVVVVPLVFIIVSIGFIITLVGFIIPTVAMWIGFLDNLIVRFLLLVVDTFARVPHGYITIGTPSLLAMVSSIGLLVLLVEARRSRTRRKAFVVAVLAVLCITIWHPVLTARDRQLVITCLDVGEGSAVLVEFPNGKNILINGGGKTGSFDRGERTVAPFFRHKGISELDAIIMTGLDDNHLGGIPYLLEHFKVNRLYDTGHKYRSWHYRHYTDLIQERHLPRHTIRCGRSIDGTGAAQVLFLHPDSTFLTAYGEPIYFNPELSAVPLVQYGKHQLILVDDLGPGALQRLARFGGKLNTVLVCHPGLARSIPDARLIKTEKDGAVIIRTDGNQLNIERMPAI